MGRFALASRCLLLGVGVLIASGCGDTRRQRVEGTVTLDGQPIADGYLRLIPGEGTPGPAAGASIKDGQFAIEAEKGPFAGTFRVEVTASREGNRKVYDPETGQMVATRRQYIPAKYNSQSELTATIAPGQSEPIEFALSSK